MPVIKDDDIIGYFVGRETVCRKHISPDEEKDIAADDLILENDLDGEDRYFCDRGGHEIS